MLISSQLCQMRLCVPVDESGVNIYHGSYHMSLTVLSWGMSVQTYEARQGCRAHLHAPGAAAKSPSPLETARSICSQPVHLEIPAFAGEVPQCNCGASTCPEHRGCGATGLHSAHNSSRILPQALRCMSKAAHVGARDLKGANALLTCLAAGQRWQQWDRSTAVKSHIMPSLGTTSSQGRGASFNLNFAALLGNSETGFYLCSKARTVRHR